MKTLTKPQAALIGVARPGETLSMLVRDANASASIKALVRNGHLSAGVVSGSHITYTVQDTPEVRACNEAYQPIPLTDPTTPIPVNELENTDEPCGDVGTLVSDEPPLTLPDQAVVSAPKLPLKDDLRIERVRQELDKSKSILPVILNISAIAGEISVLFDKNLTHSQWIEILNLFTYPGVEVRAEVNRRFAVVKRKNDDLRDCDGALLRINDWVETQTDHPYPIRKGSQGGVLGFKNGLVVVGFPDRVANDELAHFPEYRPADLKRIDPPEPKNDPIDHAAYNGGLADAALTALVQEDIKRAEQKPDPRSWATPEKRAEVNALLDDHEITPLFLKPTDEDGVWLIEDEITVGKMKANLNRMGAEIVGKVTQDWNGDEPYCVALFRLADPIYQPFPSKRQTKPVPDYPSIYAQYEALRETVNSTTRLLIQVNGDEWIALEMGATLMRRHAPLCQFSAQTVNQRGEMWDKLSIPAALLNETIANANAEGWTVALAGIVKDEAGSFSLPVRTVTEVHYADGTVEHLDTPDEETTPDEPEEYVYISLTRPAWRGDTVPDAGFVRAYSANHPVWGNAECAVYSRKLGRAELERYELRPHSDNAYEFQIGQRVTWLYNDDAYEVTGREDGRYHLLHECGDAPQFIKESELTTVFQYDSAPVAGLIVAGVDANEAPISTPTAEPAAPASKLELTPERHAAIIKRHIMGGLRLGRVESVEPVGNGGVYAVKFAHPVNTKRPVLLALDAEYEVDEVGVFTVYLRLKSAPIGDVLEQAAAVIAALPEPDEQPAPEPETPAVELLSFEAEAALMSALAAEYPDLHAACSGPTEFFLNVIARMRAVVTDAQTV